MKESEFIQHAVLAVLPAVTGMYAERYKNFCNPTDDQLNREEIAAISVSIAKETAAQLFPMYD